MSFQVFRWPSAPGFVAILCIWKYFFRISTKPESSSSSSALCDRVSDKACSEQQRASSSSHMLSLPLVRWLISLSLSVVKVTSTVNQEKKMHVLKICFFTKAGTRVTFIVCSFHPPDLNIWNSGTNTKLNREVPPDYWSFNIQQKTQ